MTTPDATTFQPALHEDETDHPAAPGARLGRRLDHGRLVPPLRGAVQIAVGHIGSDGDGPSFDLRVVHQAGRRGRFSLLTGALEAFDSGAQAPPGGHDQFEFGLQRVLDGIDTLVRAEA
jgi:hypothetical protein